ncbi:hypothetical protein [Flavobacterium sp. JP2137]|uniref:hypothetical protein n=1 Tax=Flavobacterium sp. JP2137 TaxID=3414510 RepID=UPI003D2FF92E
MGDFEIDEKARYFLFFMVFFPLICLFGWIFLEYVMDDRTNQEIFLDSRSEINCIGKVDSIYRQEMNHNILTLSTINGFFQVEGSWETKFEVGDSISKRKGELTLEHYRDGKLIEILDYNDLAKNRK